MPFISRLILDIMQPQLLDDKIEQSDMPFQEEIEMAKINRVVTIDGVKNGFALIQSKSTQKN